MAYRVIFWHPRPGTNVWLPATQPLGEAIRVDVRAGVHSAHLCAFRAVQMFQQLQNTFQNSKLDQDGLLHWNDELGNGFIARRGEQFIDVPD